MGLGCFDSELVSFLCLCLRQMLHLQRGVWRRGRSGGVERREIVQVFHREKKDSSKVLVVSFYLNESK